MKHPSQEVLALHAGGDLGWMARWRTARHLADCEQCTAEVAAFDELRETLPELRQIPEVPWNRIAAEMRANIRLGLAAGECVRSSGQPLRDGPLFTGARATLALASVLALMVTGLMLEGPAPRMPKSNEPDGAGHGEWNSAALRRSGFRLDALGRAASDLLGRRAGNVGSPLHGPGNRQCDDDESICGIT